MDKQEEPVIRVRIEPLPKPLPHDCRTRPQPLKLTPTPICLPLSIAIEHGEGHPNRSQPLLCRRQRVFGIADKHGCNMSPRHLQVKATLMCISWIWGKNNGGGPINARSSSGVAWVRRGNTRTRLILAPQRAGHRHSRHTTAAERRHILYPAVSPTTSHGQQLWCGIQPLSRFQ